MATVKSSHFVADRLLEILVYHSLWNTDEMEAQSLEWLITVANDPDIEISRNGKYSSHNFDSIHCQVIWQMQYSNSQQLGTGCEF